jgi:putative oxidoreductase
VITLSVFFSHPVFILCLRVSLGLVFIVASVDKIQNPGQFAMAIANYRLLPYEFIHGTAIVLPWIEVVAGSLLLLGIWTRANALLASSMLLVFILAIAQALWRHLDISCGCFDVASGADKMTRWTLYWDILWLFWGILLLRFGRDEYSVLHVLNRKRI